MPEKTKQKLVGDTAALGLLAEFIDAAAAYKAEGADEATKKAALDKVLALAPKVRRTGALRVFRLADPTLREAVRGVIRKPQGE